MAPTDADLATQTLTEEGSYRFASFSASDAVTLVRSFAFHYYISQYILGPFDTETVSRNVSPRQGKGPCDFDPVHCWAHAFRMHSG